MKFLKIVLFSLFAFIEVSQCKSIAGSPNRPEKLILKNILTSSINENYVVKDSKDETIAQKWNWKMLDSSLGYIRNKRSPVRLGSDCGPGFDGTSHRLIIGSNANEIFQQEQSGSGQISIFTPCRNDNNYFDGWGG